MVEAACQTVTDTKMAYSWSQVQRLFILVAITVLCIHFSLMYMLLKEFYTYNQMFKPATQIQYPDVSDDSRSPLELNDNPHWGNDLPPVDYKHKEHWIHRHLKTHTGNISDDATNSKGELKKSRHGTQNNDAKSNHTAGHCPDLPEANDDIDEPLRWQDVVPDRVYVFSAYLEPTSKDHGIILVIGMGESLWLEKENYYCQVWYRSGPKGAAVVRARLEKVEDQQPKKMAVNFWHCEVNLKKDPYALSIVHSEPCLVVNLNFLLVRNIDESQGRSRISNNFTVCHQPITKDYNNVGAFVENAELNLILGADTMVYYNHISTGSIGAYLQSYSNGGVGNVIPWLLPFYPDINGRDSYYIAHLAALNDCLYRYKYTSRYIIFADFDHFVIPKAPNTWIALFKKLQNESSWVNVFKFQRVIFPIDRIDNKTLKQKHLETKLGLVTQLQTKFFKQPSENNRPFTTYAVRPKDVDMVGDDTVLKMRRGIIKEVDNKMAAVYYYGQQDLADNAIHFKVDELMLRYSDILLKNAMKRHMLVSGI